MNTTSTKIDTVEKIIQNVVNYLSQHGEMRTAGGLSGKVLQGEYGEISFIYTTPFNKIEILPGEYANCMLDVWVAKQGKVLSVSWDPMEITKFKKGEWVNTILNIL
ncbi:MAG: hypothetical protein AMJ55_02925 [Gammaproteobacteria bacterium SG8_15]|nr:MAG: hypothetical protein AMJ55_02925 [Gammaproteobacteria bacterium SG8_15]